MNESEKATKVAGQRRSYRLIRKHTNDFRLDPR